MVNQKTKRTLATLVLAGAGIAKAIAGGQEENSGVNIEYRSPISFVYTDVNSNEADTYLVLSEERVRNTRGDTYIQRDGRILVDNTEDGNENFRDSGLSPNHPKAIAIAQVLETSKTLPVRSETPTEVSTSTIIPTQAEESVPTLSEQIESPREESPAENPTPSYNNNSITARTIQSLDAQWEAYQKHDARLYTELGNSLEALGQSVGKPETFQDDNYAEVLANVSNLANSTKARVDGSVALFTGAATTQKVGETLNKLNELRNQYATHLQTYQKGLEEFEAQTQNAHLLSKEGEEIINAKRNEIQTNIGRLTNALTQFDNLIQYVESVPKDLEFTPIQFTKEDYTGDDNLEGFVSYLSNVKKTVENELSKNSELLNSWESEIYNPQITSVRNVLQDVYDNFVVPEELDKLNQNFDIPNGYVTDIAKEKEKLQTAIASLDELLGQSASSGRTRTQRTASPSGSRISFVADAILGTGKMAVEENSPYSLQGRVGIKYDITDDFAIGGFLSGGYGFDRNVLSETTPVSPTGRYGALDVTDKTNIYAGGAVEFEYKGLILGGGAEANFYDRETREALMGSGNSVIKQTSDNKIGIEGNFGGYIGAEVGEGVIRPRVTVGWDSRNGAKVSVGLAIHPRNRERK